MIAAMEQGGGRLAINWPMAWYPTNRTASRLIAEGRIGEVLEVHYYDGNRGPLWHMAGKEERSAAQVAAEKPASWFYSRAQGGGSLLDYLGYGTTLATWFNRGQTPIEVMAMVDEPKELEVDEHAITVVRYARGLSKFETRWGTFTDPWTHQPQPKCGFVVVGAEGTISSFDFEPTIRVQTQQSPAGNDISVDEIQTALSRSGAICARLHCQRSSDRRTSIPFDLANWTADCRRCPAKCSGKTERCPVAMTRSESRIEYCHAASSPATSPSALIVPHKSTVEVSERRIDEYAEGG